MNNARSRTRSAGRHRAWFLATFAGVCAAALLLAAFGPLREASTIILFIPLLWAYMVLKVRGMVVSGVVLAAVRYAVECLSMVRAGNQIHFLAAGAEAVLPVALYLALGIAFLFYRRRRWPIEPPPGPPRRMLHDLNNCFAVINGMAEMVVRDEGTPEPCRKDTEQILQAGKRGAQIVQQIREAVQQAQQEERERGEANE